MKELETFYLTDQPECCPKCGVRTECIQEVDRVQLHQCPNCRFKYFAEEDDEFES